MKQPHKFDGKDSGILVRAPKRKSDDVRAYWATQRRQFAKPLDMERPPLDIAEPESNTE